MCTIFYIYFTECKHHEALYVPCGDRPPNTKECPNGEPREVRHNAEHLCNDCNSDDPAAWLWDLVEGDDEKQEQERLRKGEGKEREEEEKHEKEKQPPRP